MKLVTWNTQWCRGIDGVVSVERIVEGARAMADFDVLCLQEIIVNYPGLPGSRGEDQPALLRKALPGFQVFYGAAIDEVENGKRHCFGNVIATRLPVTQVQHYPLPYPMDPRTRGMPRMCSVATVLSPELGPVRVMTTHLDYYSAVQRLAQARALRALHAEASQHPLPAPTTADVGTPFQARVHTPRAILCGDFNMDASNPACAAFSEENPAAERFQPGDGAMNSGAYALLDCWKLLHGGLPQPPTFRLYDQTYGEDPIACDLVFVSTDLAPHVRRMEIDGETKVSDHQPVFVEFS